MRKAAIIRLAGLSFAAMAGVSVAAVLTPALSYADTSDAVLCRPIPPTTGPAVGPSVYGCPSSYAMVENENPTAIGAENVPGRYGVYTLSEQ